MNKFITIFATILSLMVPQLAWADSFDDYTVQQVSQCSDMTVNNAVAVSNTATTVTFTNDTKAIYIENTGSTNALFYNLSGTAVATATGGDKLAAGSNRAWMGFKTRTVSLITASSTTTAIVIGCH